MEKRDGLARSETSPLYQMVLWNGREYFTSHYFHREYLRGEHQGKAKYWKHGNFIKMVKSWESFYLYEEQGDIVYLQSWKWVKEQVSNLETLNDIKHLEEVFRANNFQPIWLMSQTAQIELWHHLDDEASKQQAYVSNKVVEQSLTSPQALPRVPPVALQDLRAIYEIGEIVGTPIHIVQAFARNTLLTTYELDIAPMLPAAPVEESEQYFSPTDIGLRLGLGNSKGNKINTMLEGWGWQRRNPVSKIWEPTERGKPFCQLMPYRAPHGTHTGYHYYWSLRAIIDEKISRRE